MKIAQLYVAIITCFVCGFSTPVLAQPFIDPVYLRYMYGIRNASGAATPHQHLLIGSDLPIKIKEKTYLLINPSYEEWHIDSAELRNIVPSIKSVAFPVGILMPIGQSRWTAMVLPVIRWSGEDLWKDNSFQYGGAALFTYALKEKQKFRAGIYLNAEFFGLFIMPLAGVDWQINEKNYLFGVLPGRLSFEHKFTDHVFGGFTFRSLSNSYRLANGQFIRLHDNQLSAFADLYAGNHFCLTLEAGIGLFRKLRFGLNGKNYTKELDWGDGPFVRLQSSYRIRLSD